VSVSALIRNLLLSQKPSINRAYQHFLTRRIPDVSAGNLAFLYHRHPKFSSLQVPVSDKEMKGGVFPSKVIIGEHGKLNR
jgi:hypothetical protein